ncbi:uncharacterized protein LOC112508647 [Cynara cardunculus var. scolymus]|uniref:uncharacterized protein LOC112508647 n=1 Tax=Cynara cardunculus var. scolymus TaxID=59895 RepID=UPI000D62AF54|nr:uncharacterized protein LOC112508647 [Cynara cardunculus var. scolymus]
MGAAFAYVFANNGYLSCFDIQSRWMAAAMAEFNINIVLIWAWFVYKESNWTVAAAIIASTWLVGSITTCGYIFVQFFKLSPEESSTNPLYFVLVKHHKRDHVRISVVTARVIVSALGCLMVGVLIYSFIVNASSPYHSNPVARCMVATVIDIYIHHVVLSVWVAYKEPSFISAFFWIVLLLCFGSIITCVYIVRQLFYLSPQHPISLILFSKSDRYLQSNDPLLKAHSDV